MSVPRQRVVVFVAMLKFTGTHQRNSACAVRDGHLYCTYLFGKGSQTIVVLDDIGTKYLSIYAFGSFAFFEIFFVYACSQSRCFLALWCMNDHCVPAPTQHLRLLETVFPGFDSINSSMSLLKMLVLIIVTRCFYPNAWFADLHGARSTRREHPPSIS